MKGKLDKVDGKWIVRYEDIASLFPFTRYEIIDLPIHPDLDTPFNNENEFREGLDVIFTNIDGYAMI
jgi:hypothetical protein